MDIFLYSGTFFLLIESINDLKALMVGCNITGIVACQAERKAGVGSPILNRTDVRIL
jgi:hypothetical protein